MAAKTHTQSPAPISTRFKSKPSFSFHSRAAESSYRGSNHNAEEDWYIPYNGPYEQPPDPFAAQGHSGVGGSKRDSWEEVLTGWRVLENEVVGGGQGSRYGGLQREDSRKTKASGSGKKAGRSRAFSNASSRITTINAATSSQGHGDAIGRKSTTSARSVATTVGAGGRANTYPYPTPPLPTLSTRVDMSGGIGDVPTPVERLSRKVSFNNGDSGGVNRSSFASFITFGRGLLHGSSSMEQLPQQYHHLQQQQQQPGLGRDSYMVTRSGIGISTANPSTNPNTHTTNSHPMDMVNTNTVGRGRANTAAELTPSASASLVVGRGGGVPGSGRQRANTETKERDRDGVEDNEYYYSTLLVHQSINGSDSIQHDSPHHHRHHTTQPTRSQSQPAYSHSQLHSYGGHQEQQGEGKEGHRQGLDEPQHPDLSLRSHPYAIAFPSSSSASPMAPGLFARNATSVFSSSNLNPYSNSNSHLNSNPANGNTKLKSRLLDTHKLSITLLDPLSHNRVPAYLKPSPRNSLLKGSLSTPNLRNVQNLNLRKLEVPKGKQRWLSAETWCDALILPRPRFALRLVDSGAGESLAANGGSVLSGRIGGAGGGNGVSVVGASLSRRIVSPPGSPILPEEARIISRENSSKESYGVERGEGYPTGRGAGGRYTEGSSSNRPLVVERSEVVRQDVGEIVGSAIIDGREGAHGGGLGERNAKPLRPKSWAWDDLAVPSPVPSLSKVLEQGKQLVEERKAWQSAATQSFQNKRARSISRARSKSLSAKEAHGRGLIRQPNGGVGVGTEAAQAFEFLAERTLLGNQARPPTIHVHGPPKRKSSRENASQTGSGTGRVTTVTSAYTHSHSHSQSNSNTMVRSGSRATKSHGHSNSMGTSTSHKSLSTESSQNSRAQSVGKSALRLVKTTASNAAAFCGFGGSPQEGEEEFTSAMKKPDLIEGALRGNGTKVIKLQDQARMDERIRNGEGGESGHVVVITPTLASAALGMVGSGGGNGYGNGNGNGNGNLNVSNNNNYSPSAHATFGAGISGAGGVSPTPSGFSTSVEGIGIAISSPPPSHSDHSYPHTFAHQQQYFPPDTSEPVILPSHPYGQATAFSYNQPAKLVIPPEAHSAEGEIEESPISAAESNTTKRRQPILVHPYAHPGHPYASTIAQTYPHQLSAAPTSDGLQPRIESSIDSDKLYAELTPGHIRKIDPNEIQYSPFSATFPHRREDSSIDAAVASSLAAAAADGSGSGGSGSGSGSGAGPTERHPYGPPVNRFSELGFGDALVRTLRDRGSMDSGLGTDETSAGKSGEGRVGERTGEGEGTTPPHGIHATFELESRKITAQYRHDPNVFPPLQPAHHVLHRREDGEDRDQTRMFVAEPESTSSTSHLGYFDHKSSRMRQASFGTVSQDQILPFDSTPPSYIRRAASTGTGLSVRAGRSSGSSPGMVSHDSSPPVSPRPINLHTSDDLERFRDLFYRPPETRAFTESPRRGLESRQNSGSIMLDVSSHSSRSVSGLTNLARQLSEDLEELRQEEEEARQRENSSLSGVSGGSGGSRMGGRDSPMWGARYGGMRGQRPDEMSLDDPNLVLSSQVSSDAESPPGGAALPLRLPTDGPFVQPVANFPEDIEPEEMESSRASSILDTAQFIEDIHHDLRIGEIEAVTTPPPIPNPQRQSTQLFIDYGRNSSLPIPSNELTVPRVVSQGSLLPTPITPDAARSSYMTSGTDTSRMSGLSDFPSPPAHVPPLPQLSSEHIPLPPRPNESQFHLDVQRPRISREDSHDTFGARSEYSVGQAL